jgi:hypothetical protein
MISIDPATFVIDIPQSYLTLISGTLYKADTDQIRKDLKTIEMGEEFIVFSDTHVHNTTVELFGVIYARTIAIIAPYSITFSPDSQWSVRLDGSNNNFGDVGAGILNQNQVQVIPTNSAGLQVVIQGSGVAPQDIDDIADAVWDEALTKADHNVTNSAGKILRQIKGTVSVDGQVNDAGATTTVFITDLTQATSSFYSNQTLVFTSGNLEGQARIILSYDGGTKTITLDPSEPLVAAPDNASDFSILADHVHPVSEVVNAVWDEPTADHQDADSTGKALKTASSAANPWRIRVNSFNTAPGTFGELVAIKFVRILNSILQKLGIK